MNWNRIIGIVFIVLIGLSACKKNTQHKQKETVIKNYNTYESDWKAIEKMEQKGLGNSIVTKVDSILSKALKEENTAQIFKSLAYRSRYYNQLIEESSLKIFNQYEEQIATSKFPVKQLLHSATAELYHQYYEQNRWKFQSRTTTQEFDKQDVRTYSLDDVLNKVDHHYQQSLTEQEDQLSYPVDNLKDILHVPDVNSALNQFDGRNLQPTLYDFLSNRALLHYQRNESRVNKPQKEFNADDYPVFSSTNQFLQIDFKSTDSSSNDLKTAQLFQHLVKAHLNDDNKSPLLNLELSRLRHYYSTSKKENKGELYLKALGELDQIFASNENASEIKYARAKYYYDEANEYNKNEETENRWYYKNAHEICSETSLGNSYGAIQCKILLAQIESKSLSLQTEKVYLPSQEIKYKIEAKNIDSLYFKLIRIPNTIEAHNSQDKSTEEYLKRLYKIEAAKEWNLNLINPKDYRSHSFEFKTKALQKGKYILLSSTQKDFTQQAATTNYIDFQVSGLGFISKNENNGSVDFYTVNRVTGKPLSDVNLTKYNYVYDYNTRKNKLEVLDTYTSDKNGFVTILTADKVRNFRILLTTNNDTLNNGGSFYSRNYIHKETKRIQTFLFSDRAIYRPGQTVYFKGIVVERGRKSNELQTNHSAEVKLINVNGEVVSNLTLKTNDYGSYDGSFTLPGSGLNGRYRLQTVGGNYSFQVEEYKRPTFEVSVDTSKESAKINQNVKVTGKVTAYSGAKVSDAKVKYRIQRRTSFPWWGYWWRPMPRTGDKEISNGELTTDSNGEFEIEFFAAADKQVASKWNPNFNFEITIDATSPTGETQSLTETISLGSKEVYLTSNISRSVQLADLKDFKIFAKNIQSAELNRKLNFKLYRLSTPKKVTRSTYWEDTEYLDNKIRAKYNDQLHEFERGPELLSGVIQSNKKSDLIGNLPPGAYEIVATTLNEDASEFQHRFELFNENVTQLAIPSVFEFKSIKMSAEPGKEASFLIGSSLKNVQLLYETHVDGKRISQKWISLNNEQQKITIPIKESYRGGLRISIIGVHNNRTIEHNQSISVPYSNKKLNITLGTYRNKVQPGSKETWTMTITGHKGQKLAAEMVAGMYDQSLDQFKTQDWTMKLYNNNGGANIWQSDGTFGATWGSNYGNERKYFNHPQRVFPSLNWFGFSLSRNYRRAYGNGGAMSMSKAEGFEGEPMVMEDAEIMMDVSESETAMSSNTKRGQPNQQAIHAQSKVNDKPISNPIRSDFRETAFFYPQLRTDKNGVISFEFEMPDALTKWKFRSLAHTKDLKVGTTETSIQTQKELMVSPTVPRFFREGDQLNLKVLISNLSEKPQSGTTKVQFFDAFTNQAINIANGSAADQKFNLFPGKNSALTWSIRIPNGLQAIKYQMTAESESFSDGEEKVIPVLPNRKLVTESLPLTIRGNQQKQFVFDKLVNHQSKTLTNESYTLEFTSNPAWYAVQALPYVVESTSECSEQVFARLYANLLAQKIAASNPRIKEVFELWKGLDSKELTSKLMQNQELKSILIEETPWLQQAKSETEQKKRIALLFDFNKMASEKSAALKKLQELQLPNGGWAWYNGMRDNRYITQYIIEGLGHLKQLGVDLTVEPGMSVLLDKGITYLDNRIVEDYEWLKKHSKDLSKNHLNQTQIHYLYTRSFFLQKELPTNSQAFEYYLKQADEYWLDRNLYMKGMQALAVARLNPDSKTPKAITASLRDNALQTDQMGMYWKENQAGYYWYNSPIETQALMVEVFHEIAKDKNAVEELRIWLLKEKQTQMWSNSKATALACYALLIDNVKALSSGSDVIVKVGKEQLKPTKVEAGTGYFKKVWSKSEVTAELGAIQVNKASDGIAWGAAYWQYYEDLEKVTAADVEEFSVSKTIFKVVVDANGEKMIPIDASGIQIGDKIRVRLRIESKRNLEFVHVKDMRASGFEPINVISRYKYQDGLGYYESTKDASTNFFMDQVNKGVYVFEYDLRATVSGEFSNGICTIQCQYAPEFNTHSKGKNLSIKN